MADAEQRVNSPAPAPKKNHRKRVIRSALLALLIVILLLASALGIMFSTDRGSKFLLDRVLERQTFIVYEYEGGN